MRNLDDKLSILKKNQENTKYFFEPFVDGANIVVQIIGRRFASDNNEYLIEKYKAIQSGWQPPQSIPKEQYKLIKNNKDECKALTGFLGIGCSYSGKWWGGCKE